MILYSLMRVSALFKFLSGSQVSSTAEYPFHQTRKVMQLAIDEDRRCRSRVRAEVIKAKQGVRSTGGRLGASVSPVAVLYNQGSTQVNSTGVYRAMYWSLYSVHERARTKLCYRYCPMAKEELGKGLPATSGKRCAYQGRKAEMKRREAQHSH